SELGRSASSTHTDRSVCIGKLTPAISVNTPSNFKRPHDRCSTRSTAKDASCTGISRSLSLVYLLPEHDAHDHMLRSPARTRRRAGACALARACVLDVHVIMSIMLILGPKIIQSQTVQHLTPHRANKHDVFFGILAR